MVRQVLYNEFTGRFELLYKDDALGGHMPVHAHNAVEIYFTRNDLENVLLGDRVYNISADSLIYIPSFCNHRIVTPDKWAFCRYILTVNTNWLNIVLGMAKEEKTGFIFSDRPAVAYVADGEKGRLTGCLERLLRNPANDLYLEMKLFLEVLEEMEKILGKEGAKDWDNSRIKLSESSKNVTKMLQFIESHRDETVTVEEIAEELHLNHDYCSRIFKKYTNTTIKQFIIIQKIAYAKQMLIAGLSVAEIQAKLGYSTYEHFVKAFKKNCGMTPKEYKQSVNHFPKE